MTYTIFLLATVALLFSDIFVHRKGGVITLKSSVLWSLLYIFAALMFSGYIFVAIGKESASLFLTGYTLEKVLAFDNLFVFSMIFAYFKIPKEDQHSALHWGIIGAVVFRFIFVYFGVSAMEFIGKTMELIFAILIAISVYVMIKSSGEDDTDYDNAPYIKLLRKLFPGITPFFVAIVAIEISDIMFSFDSVPAIIAITKDPFLIYSSMIFAILGLRSMYFIIASLSDYLFYMDTAIIVVLSFISLKLATSSLFEFHVDPVTSLLIVLFILLNGVIASIYKRRVTCLQQ